MRVLIVEDEQDFAEALSRGLAAEGFVSEVATNGVDGLWLAQQQSFDVVLLDIMLPRLSGYEVCKRLRAAGSQVPVLMLTAKDGEYDEADALDLGADDYLTKPFSFVVLVARLRALLRRGLVDRAPVLWAGDLRVDPSARRCWRGKVEVALTAREFDLAEFLIRHKGQVLSRNQIVDHVWGPDLSDDSNVVEVYLGYLRRKLDQPFAVASIETVRGAGYRMTETMSREVLTPDGTT